MKKILPLLLLFITSIITAQISQKNTEKFPIFPSCEGLQGQEIETCFYNEVQNFVFNNFKMPDNLKKNDYKGTIIVLFEVSDKGNFKVLYIDAVDESLVSESKRVFDKMPKIRQVYILYVHIYVI